MSMNAKDVFIVASLTMWGCLLVFWLPPVLVDGAGWVTKNYVCVGGN